jgi:nucleotide-binding universal stress UspA family protein
VIRPGLRANPDGTRADSGDHDDMPSVSLSAAGPVVVGVERSDSSRDALAFGWSLARAAGSTLTLVTVYPVAGGSAVMPRRTDAAEEAEATLERAARPLSSFPMTTRAEPCTSVTRGLQQVAEDEGALAIVVGPSHRGALGHVVPGSVGERLLHNAPRPIAVASRGYWSCGSRRIRTIGLGFLAAPEADEALGAAVGIALRTGAAIRVLSVLEPPASAGPFSSNDPSLQQVARDGLSQSLVRTLGDVTSPVDVAGEVVDGRADDELARLSQEVDLLICGSGGRGRLGRVTRRSVAIGVLRKARCPVLVVPRGAPDGFATLRAPVSAVA